MKLDCEKVELKERMKASFWGLLMAGLTEMNWDSNLDSLMVPTKDWMKVNYLGSLMAGVWELDLDSSSG